MEFSFSRVWLLIKKQISENRQLYFFSLLIIAGVMLVVFFGDVRSQAGLTPREQGNFFLTGLVLIGSVFTSTIFNQFSNKIKGVQNLVLPASALEKLTAAIIFSVILFPIAYFLFVYPVLYAVHIIDLNLGHLNEFYVFNIPNELQYMLTTFIFLQPVVLICPLMFKRYTTIKTVVLIGTIFFGMMFASPFITQSFIKNDHPKYIRVKDVQYDKDDYIIKTSYRTEANSTTFLYSTAFSGMRFTTPDYTRILWVQLPEKQSLIFELLMFISIPFLYIISWFKIREIEL